MFKEERLMHEWEIVSLFKLIKGTKKKKSLKRPKITSRSSKKKITN